MKKLLVAALLLAAAPAQAAVQVFACEPEWGSLAAELGGPAVSVFTATTARQDPHQIQARPGLVARLRNADLLVCTGAELETGWLPVLLRQSANPKVQPGERGYLEAADSVRLLDQPARLDRADGDVHAAGNPHIQMHPANIRAVAVVLAQRLAMIDPANAATLEKRRDDFLARWDSAMKRWQVAAEPLRGRRFVVHHKDWVYMHDWLGTIEAGTIEPKPGVPPGSAHLASLVAAMKGGGVTAVIHAAYQDGKPAQFVAERAGVPVVVLPFTVEGTDGARDLFGLFDDTLARLLAAAKR